MDNTYINNLSNSSSGDDRSDQDIQNSKFSNLISREDSNLSEDLDGVSSVISARGTEDGLVLRIDGKADWSEITKEIDIFLGGRKRFFEGGEISIEWIERLPTKEQSQYLESYLKDNFGIAIVQRRKRLHKLVSSVLMNSKKVSNCDPNISGESSDISSSSAKQDDLFSNKDCSSGSSAINTLLERVERLTQGEDYEGLTREGALSFVSDSPYQGGSYTDKVSKYLGADLLFDEEANARIIFGTLRSGQRVETPFSLIVIGDVNPGADLIAGGDVLVMGSLRGTAHAGAYEDDTLDRVIIALQMHPMQLRIGSVVSRGGNEVGNGAEVAKIDNRMIVVEPYSSKILSNRKIR